MKNLFLSVALLLCICVGATGQSSPGSTYPSSLDTPASLGETANNVLTFLSAALTASQTTVAVVDASRFPSSGWITIEQEILWYASKSGNTLQGVIRGEDGTSASAHVTGKRVEMRIVAKLFKVRSDAIRNIQAKLGAGNDINATQIQGRNIASTAPTDGQALLWSVSNSRWQPGTVSGGGGGGAVDSVFGRTGAVVAVQDDYTWAQINKATSSLADITTRSASDLSSGTLPDARFPATLPAASGANLTALNASNIASGSLADVRLSANVPLKNAANTFSANNIFGNIGIAGTAVDAEAGVNLSRSVAVDDADGLVGISVDQATSDSGVILGGRFISRISGATGLPDHPTIIGIQSQAISTNTGRVDAMLGADISIRHNGNGDVQDATILPLQFINDSGGDVAVLRGLSFQGWGNSGGSTVGTSSAIFADTSIDVGTTKWFIDSTSVSPSRMAGDLTIGGIITAGSSSIPLTAANGFILDGALSGNVPFLNTTNVWEARQRFNPAAANERIITSVGYSVTGSNSTNGVELAGTWNTSGNPSYLKMEITDTASGAASKAIEILGGAAATTPLFSVDKTGGVTLAGLLKAGSGPTTLTDAAGKILSDALNTVAVAQGGTGATDASGARANLGLAIGTNVQAFSARLSEVATIGSALQQIRVNAGGTALEYFTDSGGGSQTPWTSAIDGDGFNLEDVGSLIPRAGSILGSATLPWLESWVGNTTQYEKVSQSAGLITHAALGSATNIGFAFTPKGTGAFNITGNVVASSRIGIGTGNGTAVGDLVFRNNSGAFEAVLGDLSAFVNLKGQIFNANGSGGVNYRLGDAGPVLGLVSDASILNSAASLYMPLRVGNLKLFGLTTTTLDLMLERNAAGVAAVSNGTAGQWGSLLVGTRDAGTTTVTNGLTIGHQSTGTPGVGFGSAILFNNNTSTTPDRNSARIAAVATDSTDATRTYDTVFYNVLSAAALAEKFRIGAHGAVTFTVLTFATLPATPSAGMLVGISDSNATTFNTAITAGSGSGKGLAYYDGTQWLFR